MSKLTKIPDNVWVFLHRASRDVARMEEDRFGQEMHSQIVDHEIASPIEQLFLIALHTWRHHAHIEVAQPEFDAKANPIMGGGLSISMQEKIGKFRADFVLRNYPYMRSEPVRTIVVELDGHDFHDRDKHQRSYEKARDRFLLQQGFSTIHYTGSDVVADPYRVAREALTMIGLMGAWDGEYQPTNPFGLD